MSSISSVSAEELKARWKKLKKRRWTRQLKKLWRSLLLLGIVLGIMWVVTLPDWVIKSSNQVIIGGNQYLSTKAIKELLPIDYPQFLLKIPPAKIAKQLKSQSHLAEVVVTRQVFPPRLIIKVRERQPVAIAILSNQKNKMGFLDGQGVFMPMDKYIKPSPQSLPKLKVTGWSSQYKSSWSKIYPKVIATRIKITEIDCSDPTNLIVKTELGTVHLGTATDQLSQQLLVLDRMRNLPSKVAKSQIAYIDLKNPKVPAIKLLQIK